jgi:hypothetical protein
MVDGNMQSLRASITTLMWPTASTLSSSSNHGHACHRRLPLLASSLALLYSIARIVSRLSLECYKEVRTNKIQIPLKTPSTKFAAMLGRPRMLQVLINTLLDHGVLTAAAFRGMKEQKLDLSML